MIFKFHVSGIDRKLLVQAMGEILEVKPKYLGMPTAAYEVDYFTIDRDGTVSFDDRADSEEIENLLERLEQRGFTAEQGVSDEVPTESEQDGFTAEESNSKEESEEAEKSEHGENVALTVAVPAAGFGAAELTNLHNLIAAKRKLICKSLGVDCLPIEVTSEEILFPWFPELPDEESTRVYTHLISAICEMAKNQKRVTAAEREVPNEKYAFRCFLLRLGFIGSEYKTERKILLKNLTGSSAFRDGGVSHELSE